jgi:hypothetical protein
MPLNSTQLAALVERARHKAPPVVTPSPAPAAQRPVRARQAKPAPSAAQSPPEPQQPVQAAVPTPPPEHTAEAEDFPIGWELRKESWHFHRRFYAIFRRPMARGDPTLDIACNTLPCTFTRMGLPPQIGRRQHERQQRCFATKCATGRTAEWNSALTRSGKAQVWRGVV